MKRPVILFHCRRNITDPVVYHRFLVGIPAPHKLMAFIIVIICRLKKSVCGCYHYIISVCFHHEVLISESLHNGNAFVKVYQSFLHLIRIRKKCRCIVISIGIYMRQMIPKMIVLRHTDNILIHSNITRAEKNVVPSRHLYHNTQKLCNKNTIIGAACFCNLKKLSCVSVRLVQLPIIHMGHTHKIVIRAVQLLVTCLVSKLLQLLAQ